ncbi:MAG: metallophosphoesterase [archaeon]
MRILCMGDFHGKLPQKLCRAAKSCDLILSTGDYGGNNELTRVIFKYFTSNWMQQIGKKKTRQLLMKDYCSGKNVILALDKLNIPLISVDGNWDFVKENSDRAVIAATYPELMRRTKHVRFLHKRLLHWKGLSIYGFGGMVTASIYLSKEDFDPARRKKHRRMHAMESKQLFSKGRKGIDIVLAHYPPYGIFDKVMNKKSPMHGKHVGFKPYTAFIKKFQPSFFVCGHMHEWQGVRRLGRTRIIATGPGKEGKAAIIDTATGRIRFI